MTFFENLKLQRIVLGLAALAVFATSIQGPFTRWDDNYYVTENTRVRTPGWEGLRGIWSSSEAYSAHELEFFPLRDTVYWVLWQNFADNSVPYHLANIFFHIVAVLLVLQLALRLGLSPQAAFWGALLFAVHPIHVESVTWISGLKDPMFTSAMVGAVLAFLKYRDTLKPSHYAVAIALMVLSLLCKSLAIATPVLFLAVDRLKGQPPAWKTSLARVAGPGFIASGFMLQFLMIGRLAGVITAPHGGSWAQHYFLMGWALVRYVQQAFVPATFRIHYCFLPFQGFTDVRLLAILGLVLGIVLAGVIAVRRRAPMFALLGIWFFVCLAPVANIIPFPAIMADRYLYAPSVASCLLLAWGLSRLAALQKLVLPAVVAVFALVTLARGVFWENPANLWAEAVEDDVCLQDDLITAVLMYMNHGATAQDPAVGLAAYQKGISHPSFKNLPPHLKSLYFRKGIRLALVTGNSKQATAWGIEAVKAAPFDADAWANRALTAEEPAVALDAADHAFRLEKSADTYWLRGASRLATQQPEGVNDLVMAVDLDRKGHCKYLLMWLQEPQAEPYAASLQSLKAECESTQQKMDEGASLGKR